MSLFDSLEVALSLVWSRKLLSEFQFLILPWILCVGGQTGERNPGDRVAGEGREALVIPPRLSDGHDSALGGLLPQGG